MKKLNIILSAAFLVGLAACDDDSDLGKMQINPELPRVPADCVTIAPGDAFAQASWNLDDLYRQNHVTTFNIAKTTATNELPEGAKITYGTEFSATEDFKNPVFKELKDGDISLVELNDIFRELFGMGPKPHTMYIRSEAMVHVGTQVSIAGTGADCWQFEKAVEITPIPKPMEEQYYFLSDATNWKLNPTESVEMSHMSDVNIYDYPYFWIVLDCTAEKTYCKIAPKSAVDEGNWDLVLGSENEAATTGGTLSVAFNGAFVIAGPGRYIVRFNAMESTFTVVPAAEALYTPGDGLNNWSPATAFPLTTTDYVNYSGFSYLGAGGYKLVVQPDWNGPGDYSQGSEDGWIAWYAKDGANIVPPVTDFAYIKVSTGSWQISYTAVTTLSLCGDFNNWASDLDMTHDALWQKWSAVVDFPAGKLGFKIRANHDWPINYGLVKGSATDLVNDGENITVPAPGKYEIVADFSKAPYTVTITPQ